jgi:hypothetical protein
LIRGLVAAVAAGAMLLGGITQWARALPSGLDAVRG